MSFLTIDIDYSARKAGRLAHFSIVQEASYYIVKDEDNRTIAKLRQRAYYPGTFCLIRHDGSVVMGYGANTKNGEYLIILIEPSGHITIERDAYVTLPIFYRWDQDKRHFQLNNHFDAIHADRLNTSHLVNVLIPNPDYHQTLYQDVVILDERHKLEVTEAGIQVTPPEARAWTISKEAPPTNPHDFHNAFKRQFEYFIESRLDHQPFAFEVSGGIDSATLPLYWVETRPAVPAVIATMMFPGEFNDTQQAKVVALEQRGLTSLRTDIKLQEDYPLARFIIGQQRSKFYSFEEIYTEPLMKQAAALAERGIAVIATGVGGDELFENLTSLESEYQFGKITRQIRAKQNLPSYLTADFRRHWIDSTPASMPYPLPLLSVSYHGANLARNNIYIDYDIWPVSPFSTPQFYQLCQGLPITHRANKNILRAFHQSHEYPAIIYNPSTNEDFSQFFRDSFLSDTYEPVVDKLLTSSQTAELGLVDVNKLKILWEGRNKLEHNDERDRLLFYLFGWLTCELNLLSE